MEVAMMRIVSVAVVRAVAIVLGGIAFCALLLGAVGFALVAVFGLLVPTLGPAPAAFATSGVAIAVPILVTAGLLIATRTSLRTQENQPAPSYRMPAEARPQPQPAVTSASVDHALGWIASNPKTAALGALSVGVALGACPDIRRTVLSGLESALTQQRSTG